MITNQKLRCITERAASDLTSFIEESEEKLMEAWSAAVAEAQDNDTKAKLKIGYSVSLDLDADKMQTSLSFGVKHKLSRDGEIPDPDQPALPLSEEDQQLQEAINKELSKPRVRSPKDSGN